MTTEDLRAELYWLPSATDFDRALARARDGEAAPADRLAALRGLAGSRLDFMRTAKVERALRSLPPDATGALHPVRLTILAGHTVDHLVPAIRVAGLRRGLLVDCRVGPYGQWRQQILDPGSELYRSQAEAVVLAPSADELLPAASLSAGRAEAEAAVTRTVTELAGLWRILRGRLRAAVIQQVPLPPLPLFGHHERLVPGSPGALAARLGVALADVAAEEGVHLLDLAGAAARIGTGAVSDPRLWHHARQEIAPAAGPWAGEQVGRILGALRGRSRKALVLDLDDTLWGGIIGEDGIDGIAIGQGSAEGEAFLAFQRYVRHLAARGVVLAVSSKNDPEVALGPFERHPDMLLRRADFAAFEAGWGDKPAAVRRIAEELRLGLDALVFVDDNPAERALMRRTLPEVAVPEIPPAPERYAQCLADAGYFEAVSFTADDAQRAAQYAADAERRRVQAGATDLEGFLRDLAMVLEVRRIEPVSLARATQLINKTNQFNLTTRRYDEAEVAALARDPSVLTFCGRLTDRLGDNGIVSVVIGRLVEEGAERVLDIDTWLMSCRVLGRRVEQAMLGTVAAAAARAGATALIGRYRPTPRNGLVRELYPSLGFAPAGEGDGGETVWRLPLAGTASGPAANDMTANDTLPLIEVRFHD
jgi:FkbH-like protein